MLQPMVRKRLIIIVMLKLSTKYFNDIRHVHTLSEYRWVTQNVKRKRSARNIIFS